ncbi:hypothetical protein FRC09_020918 [Ceratobasidium sp. 395]|nr:hypothetical protein FRC09_020918 [Ceratobasidium sp. 395]
MPPKRASSFLSISRSLARFSPLSATRRFPSALRDSYNQIYSALQGLARLPGLARRIEAPQLQAQAEMAGIVPHGGAIMPNFPLALQVNEPEANVEHYDFDAQPVDPNYPNHGGVRRLNGLPGLWIDGADGETNDETNDSAEESSNYPASTVGDVTGDEVDVMEGEVEYVTDYVTEDEEATVTEDEVGEAEAGSVGEDGVDEAIVQERERSVITVSSDGDSDDSGVDLYEGLPEYVYNIDQQNNIGFEAAPIADGFWQVRPRYGTVRYRGCRNLCGSPLSRSRRNTWSISREGLFDTRPAAAATVADIHYSLDGDKFKYWVCCERDGGESEGGEEGEIVQEWVPYELGDPHPTDPRFKLYQRGGFAPCWSG